MGGSVWVKSGLEKPSNFRDITPGLARRIAGNLSFAQKLSLRIRGSVYLDQLSLDEWPGKVPIYLFKCDFHGFEINYPYGYDEILMCTECLVEHRALSPDPSRYFPSEPVESRKKSVPVISN